MRSVGFRLPHFRNLEVYHDLFLNSARWMKLDMLHGSPQCGIGTFLPQEWDTGGTCFAALSMHENLPSRNYDAFLRDGTLPDREDSLVGQSIVQKSVVLLAKQVGVDAIGAWNHCYQVDLVMSERTVPCYPGYPPPMLSSSSTSTQGIHVPSFLSLQASLNADVHFYQHSCRWLG